MEVGRYILEIFDCISLDLREQVKKVIENAGMIIIDEKINFRHKSSKLYLSLKLSDSNTEESFIRKLKASPFAVNCSCLYKIERGYIDRKNLLAD